MSRLSLMALALLPLAVACDKDGEDSTHDDDHHASNMPYCEDTAAPLAPEDDGGFGLSGQAFLDSIPAQLDGSAGFADDGEAGLQVVVSVDPASLRSVASEAVYPDTGGPSPSIAVICPHRVEVDATVELHSDDGQLAEVLEVVLVTVDPAEMGSPLGEVVFSAELDPDALGGSLDLADFADLDAYDAVSMSVYAAILEGRLLGEVSAQGEAAQGNTAMVERIPVADLDAVAAE